MKLRRGALASEFWAPVHHLVNEIAPRMVHPTPPISKNEERTQQVVCHQQNARGTNPNDLGQVAVKPAWRGLLGEMARTAENDSARVSRCTKSILCRSGVDHPLAGSRHSRPADRATPHPAFFGLYQTVQTFVGHPRSLESDAPSRRGLGRSREVSGDSIGVLKSALYPGRAPVSDYHPLPRGKGGPRPALLPAGAGRVVGLLFLQTTVTRRCESGSIPGS